MEITINGQKTEITNSFPRQARWIGPIPNVHIETPDEDELEAWWYYNGGDTPAFGGYHAVKGTDGIVRAHTSKTILVPKEENGEIVWFVEAPMGRQANRAVNIASDAIRLNASITDAELRSLGIFKAEIAAARRGRFMLD